MNQAVAVDSNMLTYLHDATSPSFDPTANPSDDLVVQKVALVRTVFYWDGILKIVPTVSVEYQRIQDSARRQSHDVFAMVLFEPVIDLDLQKAESLRNYFLQFHGNTDDCQIVAEAELAGMEVLLTYDEALRMRLSPKLQTLRLMDAKEFWNGLNIPKGASARILPRQGNSLCEKSWWVW